MALSELERLIISSVTVLEYYNKMIVPLNSKFKPLSSATDQALCPFHDDHNPSFRDWRKKRLFHCWVCDIGGDIIRLHVLLRSRYYNESLSRRDSAVSIARLWGIPYEEELKIFDSVSVFGKARALLSAESYVIKNDVLTVPRWADMNARVITGDYSNEIKVANYAYLDLLLAAMFVE